MSIKLAPSSPIVLQEVSAGVTDGYDYLQSEKRCSFVNYAERLRLPRPQVTKAQVQSLVTAYNNPAAALSVNNVP